MPTFLHIPSPPLSQFIDCFWYVDLMVPYTREKILPTGTIELMLNFGAPHRKYNQAESDFELMTEAWVAGFQTEYIVNEPVAETNMIGVRFKPGGAYPFLGGVVHELQNTVVDLEAVIGYEAAEMREQLYEQPTIAARFELLQKWLLEQLRGDLEGLEAVRYAVQTLDQLSGRLSIRELSEQVGMSQKHLIHQFKKMVGVSPKQCARVLTLQKVLHLIDPTTPVNWSAIAHECHYYDQAHFNRDFKAFTGLTPAQYVTLRQAHFVDVQQGEEVHFVPIIG